MEVTPFACSPVTVSLIMMDVIPRASALKAAEMVHPETKDLNGEAMAVELVSHIYICVDHCIQ